MKLKEVISKTFFPWHAHHTVGRQGKQRRGRRTSRKRNKISHSIMDLEWVSWTLGSCRLFNTQRTMSPFQESEKTDNDSWFPPKNNSPLTGIQFYSCNLHIHMIYIWLADTGLFLAKASLLIVFSTIR